MTKYFPFLILVALQLSLFAEPFEGKITFQKITATDTSYFSYYVKNNFIKVDELTKTEQLINSMLINLDDSSLIAISPLRKMYMTMPVQPFYGYNDSSFIIQKTNSTLKLLNYTCKKWEVVNKNLKTSIEYYVASDSFDFFLPFLKITNRSEKSAGFFLQISGAEGFFPLKSIEYNIEENTINLMLVVTKIEKMKLDDSIFEIPSDYMLFEH